MGSRVWSIRSRSATKAARQVAYEAIQGIRFDGMQFRQDIGHRAMKPVQVATRPADE